MILKTNRVACTLMLILLSLQAPLHTVAAPERTDQRALVRHFVAAFNDRDVEAMLSLAHADIVWLNIEGARISTQARGGDALRASMQNQFASCPSCRSHLIQMHSSAQRVWAVEVARWTTTTGTQSQRSPAIHEFEQGLIRRVYYFPAER